MRTPGYERTCGIMVSAENRYPLASTSKARKPMLGNLLNSRTAVTRSVTIFMASTAGTKLSIRANCVAANGAVAEKPINKTIMSAAARRRSRAVGGTVAIENSNSSETVCPANGTPVMSARPFSKIISLQTLLTRCVHRIVFKR